MIVEAFEARALPDRTRIVQCVAREPHSATDFSYPAVCRGKKNVCAEMAAALAHVTEFLSSPKGMSSHERVRKYGDTDIGNFVLFSSSKNCAIIDRLPFPAHAAFIGLKKLSDAKVPVATVEHYLRPSDEDTPLWSFDMAKCIAEHREKRTPSVTGEITQATITVAKCFPAQHVQSDKNRETVNESAIAKTEALLESITGDGPYLNRVSTLAATGQIVLCAPQVIFYGPEHEHNSVFDAGLTLVLEGQEPVTQTELLQIYIVSRSLAQFLASVYGLVKEVARAEKHNAVQALSKALTHEVGNMLAILKRKLRPIQMSNSAREDVHAHMHIAAKAARAVAGQAEEERRPAAEQFEELINEYLDLSDFNLAYESTTSGGADTAVEIPVAFGLALNEMLRNAYKHAVRDSSNVARATCRMNVNARTIFVEVSNEATEDTRRDVCKALNAATRETVGLERLRELAAILPKGRISARSGNGNTIVVILELTT